MEVVKMVEVVKVEIRDEETAGAKARLVGTK